MKTHRVSGMQLCLNVAQLGTLSWLWPPNACVCVFGTDCSLPSAPTASEELRSSSGGRLLNAQVEDACPLLLLNASRVGSLCMAQLQHGLNYATHIADLCINAEVLWTQLQVVCEWITGQI